MTNYEHIRQRLDGLDDEQWRQANRGIKGRTTHETRNNLTLLLDELGVEVPKREDGQVDDQTIKELLYTTKNPGPSARALNFLSHRHSHLGTEADDLIRRWY